MWHLLDKTLESRLIMGTALFPSLDCLSQAIQASGTSLITVALKRQLQGEGTNPFWDTLQTISPSTPYSILPNTAGCRTANEAISIAHMAREIFNTTWIKLEVIGDDYSLTPNPFELVKAAERLLADGFQVFPYCTEDLILCKTLVKLGCKIIMPWGSPIGSGKGLLNPYALRQLRERYPEILLIIDAGIGKPSDAAQAMELGFDAVLLNSAIAKALDPVAMALAFSKAISAGRLAFEAGLMPQRDFASPSTPLTDVPFWKQGLPL